MPAKLGPLLLSILDRLSDKAQETGAKLAASAGLADGTEQLPVFAKLPAIRPVPGELWPRYRERVWQTMRPILDQAQQTLGVRVQALLAGNAMQLTGSPDQIRRLANDSRLEIVELDRRLRVVSMDEAVADVALDAFITKYPASTGEGIRVAVIDSGVDEAHPYLQVKHSVSTVTEPAAIPGHHGTHCAGSIASRDATFRGIAPGVELHNIKVLDAYGYGQSTGITKGIDEALDSGAQVLSMSLGFNHLPISSWDGHGWACATGDCPLCTAVDNAVALEGVVAVVAAGNEHMRASSLRADGQGETFDTELTCPGQARRAITVGAVSKTSFALAPFSSWGPTAYGDPKPDLVAPGVAITSTIPAPRDAGGVVVPSPPRSQLFGSDSGTSMATPIVAGIVALLIERAQRNGGTWTPASIRSELLTTVVTAMAGIDPLHVGAGRVDLSHL